MRAILKVENRWEGSKKFHSNTDGYIYMISRKTCAYKLNSDHHISWFKRLMSMGYGGDSPFWLHITRAPQLASTVLAVDNEFNHN